MSDPDFAEWSGVVLQHCGDGDQKFVLRWSARWSKADGVEDRDGCVRSFASALILLGKPRSREAHALLVQMLKDADPHLYWAEMNIDMRPSWTAHPYWETHDPDEGP